MHALLTSRWHIYGLLRRQPLQGNSLASALLFARTVVHHVLEKYDMDHVTQLLETGASLSDSGSCWPARLTPCILQCLQPMTWSWVAGHKAICPSLARAVVDLVIHHPEYALLACRLHMPSSALQASSPPRCRASYLVRLEAVQLLVVLISSQLYSPAAAGPADAHPFTAALMQQPDLAPGLVQVCLPEGARTAGLHCLRARFEQVSLSS